jgi:hypothetical protein
MMFALYWTCVDLFPCHYSLNNTEQQLQCCGIFSSTMDHIYGSESMIIMEDNALFMVMLVKFTLLSDLLHVVFNQDRQINKRKQVF